MYPCLIQAAAILLKKSVEDLVGDIGFSGKEYVKGVKRSHHIQEIIDLFLRHGYALVGIWPRLLGEIYGYKEPVEYISQEKAKKRFKIYLKYYSGIIILDLKIRHACAWTRERVIDPKGIDYEMNKTILSQISEFYAMIPIVNR